MKKQNSKSLRDLSRKPLNVLVEFSGGLSAYVEQEIREILEDPWFPDKTDTTRPTLSCYPEKIAIRKISLQSVLSIAYRSSTIRDLWIDITGSLGFQELKNLDISQDLKTWLESKGYNWKTLVRKNQDPIFDPTQARNYFSDCLGSWFVDFSRLPAQERYENRVNEKPRFLFHVYENKISLYLGVFAQPNYQRGFREELSESYPLSEDRASIFLRILQDLRKKGSEESSGTYLIPFSGTGTLGWEAFFQEENILPGRIQNHLSPYWKYFHAEKIGAHLEKKAKSQETKQSNNTAYPKYQLWDYSEKAIQNSRINLENLEKILMEKGIQISKKDFSIGKKDFFEEKLFPEESSVSTFFLPLHPPFGIRSHRKEPNASFYKRIAEKIRMDWISYKESRCMISQETESKTPELFGFILIPDSLALNAVLKTWDSHFLHKIANYSQGKLSIRALFFWDSP